MLKAALFATYLVTLSTLSAQAQLQSPDYCTWKHGTSVGLPTSTNIIFAGSPLTVNDWTVDHSEITISFGNLVLSYDPSSVEHISALMDWISTAANNETKYGYATLAILDHERNVVWLLSQSIHADKRSCFGHALPLPEEPTS